MSDERTTVGERVRAVLITRAGRLLMIRRIRAGVPPYWVFPGGGVEADDENRESALLREIREETGGAASIRKLLFILESGEGSAAVNRELFYLADVESWDERARGGPEFLNRDSGEYVLDEFTLNDDEIQSRDIRPDAMKRWLLRHHAALDAQPDLRDRAGMSATSSTRSPAA